jgi:arsenate reductase
MSKPHAKKSVLFVCTHNSARSQMAEGLMNADHSEAYEAQSGGTEPALVNPYAIRAMSEIGIDISHHTSKSVDQFLDQDLDYVVTVCDHANEACPFFPGGKKRIHKGFEDPAAVKGTDAEKLEAFRRIRGEIRDWIDHELAGFEV